MTYEELLRSAMSNAQRGMSPEQARMVDDSLSLADTLFPIVSQGVCESAAADEYRRSLVTRTKSLTVVAGSATLTDDVLTHYMADSVLLNPSALTQKYAWRAYPDFVRRGDTRLGVYSIQGASTFVVCAPNVAFAVPLTTAGTYSLTIPCVVVKPAVYTDDVDAPDEIISDLDEALANALRGAIIKEASAAA